MEPKLTTDFKAWHFVVVVVWFIAGIVGCIFFGIWLAREFEITNEYVLEAIVAIVGFPVMVSLLWPLVWVGLLPKSLLSFEGTVEEGKDEDSQWDG